MYTPKNQVKSSQVRLFLDFSVLEVVNFLSDSSSARIILPNDFQKEDTSLYVGYFRKSHGNLSMSTTHGYLLFWHLRGSNLVLKFYHVLFEKVALSLCELTTELCENRCLLKHPSCVIPLLNVHKNNILLFDKYSSVALLVNILTYK